VDELLAAFIKELRAAGLPVSIAEHLDAAQALSVINLENRDALKSALGATLVKSAAHWRVFDVAFEVYFSRRNNVGTQEDKDGEGNADAKPQSGLSGDSGLTPSQISALAEQALRDGEEAIMGALAQLAVKRFAGLEPGRPVGGTYYLHRTLRALDLEGLAMALRNEAAEDDTLTPLERRLFEDELAVRLARIKNAIETAIREYLVADRGHEALARSVRRALPEDVDLLHANHEELAEIEAALRPLTRILATKLAIKRRRRRGGPLDISATMRESLASGGVPLDVRFKPRRPAKPEIVVIADISGSVSSFARFTLQLVYAISEQFSSVRSFVFIDDVDEVTHLFHEAKDPAHATAAVAAHASVVWLDGHSDYGHAFFEFERRYGDQITSRSNVIILGDARNNYHDPGVAALAEIRQRARHLYWLNPEPTAYWNSGDSVVASYAPLCDKVVECRTLRQLESFVSLLA
jgi:hypothetical protein